MPAAGFNPTELNKYLSEKKHSGLWHRISRATGAELESLLLEAELHRLMQHINAPASGEEAGARCKEVGNAVAKQATGRFAGTANAVRVGLDHLSRQPQRHNPAALALWSWYFPVLNERSQQQVTDAVGAMLTHYEARGVADLEDLSRRLGNRGLDQPAQDEVLAQVLAYGLRVVRPLTSDVISRIDHSTAPNIVALLRPTTWAADPGLTYSAYDAAPTGQRPVMKQDVEEAISYFDTRRQQLNKDAVNKIGSACPTDQALQDAVLAYHLAKVLDAAQHGVPAETVKEFRDGGLIAEDARRLLGQSSTAAPDEPVAPNAADIVEEESDYRRVEELLDQREARSAREYYRALESANGKPVTEYGRRIALRVIQQNTEADNHLRSAQQTRAGGNLPQSQEEIRLARGFCVDDDVINNLSQEIDDRLYHQRIEESDHNYFIPALAAVADRKIARAGELLAAAVEARAESTAASQQATVEYRRAIDTATSQVQIAEKALAQDNLIAAHREIKVARELAEDMSEVNALWKRVQQKQFEERVIDREMGVQGYQPITSPRYEQVALLPATTTWLRHLLFLFLPAAVLDFLVFHTLLADPAPGVEVLPWIVAVAVLAWLLQGVLSRLAQGRGCFLRLVVVILSLTLMMNLAFDGLWFTVVATAALAFNMPRMRANWASSEQVKEWNDFIRRFRDQARKEGLLNISVQAKAPGHQHPSPVFPTSPQGTRPVVTQEGQNSTVKADLQLRDSTGTALAHLSWNTRQNLMNNKLFPVPDSDPAGAGGR